MRDPAFWWAKPGAAAAALWPAAALYGAVAGRRMTRAGRAATVPVVCVGNFTVGGAGKTPAAIALAKLAIAAGRKPFFLSRGYGGSLTGPLQVDGQRADEVGDEPLLLARTAPAIVARDRPAGARAAAAAGADLVIMDDGLQNPSLAKDFAIAVVDARRGIGNGRVFPAGPLRAPLAAQFGCVDAVLVAGAVTPLSRGVVDESAGRGLPVFRALLRPDAADVAALAGRPVLAFAGIADPDRFFATLEAAGIPAAARRPFADHHRFTAAEAATLLAQADRDRLTLLTTEKDAARMRGDPAAAQLLERLKTLRVELVLDGGEGPALLAAVLSGIRRPAQGKGA
jgi:tetraacyldisaccharide 4'-kinase